MLVWHRKVDIGGGVIEWRVRIVKRFYHFTNFEDAFRVVEVDPGNIVTLHNNRVFDFAMSSAEFRQTIAKCVARVKHEHKAAFGPQPRLRVQYFEGMHNYRYVGDYREKWIILEGMDDRWDVSSTNETVGDMQYLNIPFQVTYRSGRAGDRESSLSPPSPNCVLGWAAC